MPKTNPTADMIELAMRHQMPSMDNEIAMVQSDPVLAKIFADLLARRAGGPSKGADLNQHDNESNEDVAVPVTHK